MKYRPILTAFMITCTIVMPTFGRGTDDSSTRVELRAVFSPFLTSAPLFIGMENGYFADEGIDVELVFANVSSDSLTALIRNEVDVVTGGVNTALMNAISEGAMIRLVASRGYIGPNGDYISILASERIIRDGLDLATAPAGSRIVAREDNFMGYLFTRAVEKAGGDPSIFVNTVATSPAAVAMMETGQLEFTTASEPTTSQILSSGKAKVIGKASDVIPDFDYGYILFGPSILQGNTDAGYAFMRAYRRGVAAYEEGKTESNIAAIAKYTDTDPETLRSVSWPEFRPDLSMPVEGFIDFQRYAMEIGLMDEMVSPEKAIDSRFIK